MKQRTSRRMYMLAFMIVVGSVMSFGLVATLMLKITQQEALAMLGMIPFMSALVFFGIRYVMQDIDKKNQRLIDAIHTVADGDLTTRIPEEGAEEYTQVYREFNRMSEELSKTKKEMDEFINVFSHEVKTPITSIRGFAKYLADTGKTIETGERMEYLHVIDEQSGRLLRLCENALLLSKLDAMEIVPNRREYDIAEQIRRIAIGLLPQMEKKNLDFKMDEDLVLPLRGNEELMDHVWMNLLVNAIKYTPENGTIEVYGEKTPGQVSVSIRDNGIGMEEAVQKRIFERYYQIDSDSITKGNGIGLAIVQRICILHGGTVSVCSEPEKGSTFTVLLPNRLEILTDETGSI